MSWRTSRRAELIFVVIATTVALTLYGWMLDSLMRDYGVWPALFFFVAMVYVAFRLDHRWR